MKRLSGLLLSLPMMAASGSSYAVSLSGNYLLTMNTTHPRGGTEQYCLSLADDGTVLGWPHSGGALIGGYIPGQFFVAGSTLVATIGFHGVTFAFSAPIHAGGAGPASFIAVNDGDIVSSGTVSAGAKGRCTPPS